MEVACLSIVYHPGSFDLHQGISRHGEGRKGNHLFSNRGGGWEADIVKSKLVLHVKTEKGAIADIWIDSFFKKNLGKLTEWRRTLIAETMPPKIGTESCVGLNGTMYLVASQRDLEDWLRRCSDRWYIDLAEKKMKALKRKRAATSKAKT